MSHVRPKVRESCPSAPCTLAVGRCAKDLQKTRVKKLILAVNGLCDATLTHYGTKMGLLEGITGQGQGFAPCPSHPQHGARALRKRVPLYR